MLIHFTNDKLEPSLKDVTADTSPKVHISWGEPMAVSRGGKLAGELVSDFGLPQGLCVSFCTPVRDGRGRILVPVQWQKRDTTGELRKLNLPVRGDMPEVMSDYGEAALLIGEFQGDKLSWRRAGSVPCQSGKTSRGTYEPAIAELASGRLVAVLRGSNHHWPDKPGYKWLSVSGDGGESWSQITPLPCDDGTLIESSSTGSAFFRSATDGRLYWIGNLCADGERPSGWGSNMPRSPIVIARIREEPFAIERSTITTIDTRRPGEHHDVQHSNFKFYQDRRSGDVVVYLTRYGERGYENNAWILADHYEYRLAMG